MAQSTSNTPAEKSAKKSRWCRIWSATKRTIIALIAIVILVYAILSYWASHAAARELARIRAAGEPTSFAELDAMTPKADPAHDAGPLYQAAAILAAADPIPQKLYQTILVNPPEGVTAEIVAQAADYLARNQRALELLDRAAAQPECSAAADIEYGAGIELREISRYSKLANLAALRTRVLIQQGKPAGDSLDASARLLRVFDRQPILTDTLVETAVLLHCCNDAQLLLERGNATDASLNSLAETFAALRPITPHRMMLAERVYAMEITRTLLTGSNAQSVNAPDSPIFPDRFTQASGPLARMGAVDTLEAEGRFADATRDSYPAMLDEAQAIADNPGGRFTLFGALTRVLAPSFADTLVHLAQRDSRLAATQASIQVERYRLAHAGALPDSLTALLNAATLPADPLTSKPLLYTRTADGYCIYSAGYHPPADRDKNPIDWSQKWGIHIRTAPPQ